jgi:hypothetical protein
MHDIREDTNEIFELRLKLYSQFPILANSFIDFKSMLKKCELRAIRYFKFLLENKIKNNEKNIYRYELEYLEESSEVMIKNGEEVIKLLLPLVPKDLMRLISLVIGQRDIIIKIHLKELV